MSQVNQFLSDLNKTSDRVKKCTRPLHHLGVNCFYYFSIKENGDQILLTDSPHIDEYYYQEKIYLKDPYLRHPDNFKSGFFFFESIKKEEFDQSLGFVVRTFQISPLVGLCEKEKDGVEFFGFWGENSSLFEHIFLNYAKLLKVFVKHFKKECSPILKPNIAPSLSVKELIGAERFGAKSVSNRNTTVLKKYLLQMGCGDEINKAESLSSREKECIKLLLHGKSTKEIAAVLNLSSRTVEHYLDNIKNKLDCQYKHQLFSIAERLIGMDLI